MKMQTIYKYHFWPFWGLVFEIEHICRNIFVFTIRKNNFDDCGYKQSFLQKKVDVKDI